MMHDKPTDLYRHYDADGRLLYVGISLDAFSRLRQHNRDSKWAGQKVTMTTVPYQNRAAALAAEAEAIRTENPIYNVVGALCTEYRAPKVKTTTLRAKKPKLWIASWHDDGAVEQALCAINTAASFLFAFRIPGERQSVAIGSDGALSIDAQLVGGDTRNQTVSLKFPNGVAHIVSFGMEQGQEKPMGYWTFYPTEKIANHVGMTDESTKRQPPDDAIPAFERALYRYRKEFEHFTSQEKPAPTHYAPAWAAWA
jgi:predicted GIY-YIG superfamily endonuclease